MECLVIVYGVSSYCVCVSSYCIWRVQLLYIGCLVIVYGVSSCCIRSVYLLIWGCLVTVYGGVYLLYMGGLVIV